MSLHVLYPPLETTLMYYPMYSIQQKTISGHLRVLCTWSHWPKELFQLNCAWVRPLRKNMARPTGSRWRKMSSPQCFLEKVLKIRVLITLTASCEELNTWMVSGVYLCFLICGPDVLFVLATGKFEVSTWPTFPMFCGSRMYVFD